MEDSAIVLASTYHHTRDIENTKRETRNKRGCTLGRKEPNITDRKAPDK
jgi:hypothetical protein